VYPDARQEDGLSEQPRDGEYPDMIAGRTSEKLEKLV